MKNFDETQSCKDIKRLIGNVARSGKAFEGHVQAACIAIMRHSEATNDCTGAERLVAALPNSTKTRGTVCAYFALYSPINVRRVKEGGTQGFKASLRNSDSKLYNPYNVTGAEMNPWFAMESAQSTPKLYTDVDVQNEIERLVKRLTTAVEEGRVTGNISQRLAILTTATKDVLPLEASTPAPTVEELPLAKAA